MSRHLAFVLMTVVVGASPLEGGTPRFTLTEAIDRARSTSAKLCQLSAYRDAAGAGVTEAESATRPAVGLRASYSRRSDVPEFRIATPDVGETTIYPDMPNAYSARMAIGYPLYTGGRVRST